MQKGEWMKNGGKNGYDEVKKALSEIGNNFFILEAQIDVKTLKTYFRLSRLLKSISAEERLIARVCDLKDEGVSLNRKRMILSALAMSKDPSSYRIIEDFSTDSMPELNDWVILAENESRLTLESAFTGVKRILISSGLGGRKNKLRYLIVLKFVGKELMGYQRELVQGEAECVFEKEGCELEDLREERAYFFLKVLIPIRADVASLVTKLLVQINEFGSFIDSEPLITNVKELDWEEVDEIYREKTLEQEEE